MFVNDYEIFWEGLKNNEIIQNEHQISNGITALFEKSTLIPIDIEWEDIGDLKKYQNILSQSENFDFSKPSEFIYFVNDNVIKFTAESQNISQVVEKSKICSELFPKIKLSGKNFFNYEYFSGDVFYNIDNISTFESLLNFLEKNLWNKLLVDEDRMNALCKKFYHEKTITRINNFKKKYGNYQSPSSVNGKNIHTLNEIIEKIPWKDLFNGIPCFIHGDLNFGNILQRINLIG